MVKKDKLNLLKFLKRQNFMSLSTYSDQPWISSIYYAVDNDFNLYFLSEPSSKHCKDIEANPKVAVAIASSKQKVTDKKIGVQLQGKAEMLGNVAKIKFILSLWNKVNPGFESVINLKNIQNKVIKSRVYRITPVLIKFFNEELYGPEGVEIFEFK